MSGDANDVEDILKYEAECLEILFYEILETMRENENSRRRLEPLLKHNYNAYKPQETLSWWQDKRLPTSLAFLKHAIEKGEQPVFCNISLYTLSSAPTLYIPVPYLRAKDGFNGFRETIWLNAPGWDQASKSQQTRLPEWMTSEINWENAAREYSHAITNISYSVRVGDIPILGWLAQAHAGNCTIYIPDVRRLKERGGVKTVAVEEESYLGMASVLYIPLTHEKHLPTYTLDENELNDNEHAQAVLMLWSPLPHRWDSLLKATPNNAVNECSWCSWKDDVVAPLGSNLRWLGGIISKDKVDQHIEYRRLSHVIKAINSWALDCPATSGVKGYVNSLLHGLEHFFKHSPKDEQSLSSYGVRNWLNFLVKNVDGPVRRLSECTKLF